MQPEAVPLTDGGDNFCAFCRSKPFPILGFGFLPRFFGSGSLHSAALPCDTQREQGRLVSQAACAFLQ